MYVDSRRRRAALRRFAFGVALALLVSCSSDQSSTDSLVGVWGGEGIRMTVGLEGAVIQYDCGTGTIDSAIHPDAVGHFQGAGTFTRGGGPEPVGGRPQQATLYQGTVVRGAMELTGTVLETGQSLGPFNLRQGDNGRLVLCF